MTRGPWHALSSRLSVKLVGSSLVLLVLMASLAFYSAEYGRRALIETVGTDTVNLADTLSSAVDRTLYQKHHELWFTGSGSLSQGEMAASNAAFDAMEDPYGHIASVDAEWRAAPLSETTASMDLILATDLSRELWDLLDDHYEREHGIDIYKSVTITNKYGAVVAMSVRTAGYSLAGEPWWPSCVEDGRHFGEVEYDRDRNLYGLCISSRLVDADGAFAGTITAFVDIVAVAKEAAFLVSKYETTEVSILTRDGRLIYATGAFRILEDLSDRDYYTKATEESGYFLAQEGERTRLFSYTHSVGYLNYEGHGWMVMVSHDQAEVLATVSDLTSNLLIASVLVISAALATSYVISTRISRPVRELAMDARELSRGNLGARADIRRSDEIGQLAESFNQMAAELQSLYTDLEGKVRERTEELEQVTRKLRLLGSVTRHDAINQITVLRGWLSIIEENIEDQELLARLKKVEEAGENIRAYLEFTGDYEKVGVHGPEWIDLGEEVPAHLFGLNMGSIRFTNGLEGVQVYGDPMLPKVFRNLLDNSIKHGGAVTSASLTWHEVPDGLRIVYEDDGSGVPPEAKDALFERTSREGRRSFGLYLSREVLSITGLTIEETGTPGKGARFEIAVPEGKYRVPGQGSTGPDRAGA